MRLWLYNDTSCAALLKSGSALYPEQLPRFVVEVATAPNFEYVFGYQSPTGFPGVCGILSPGLGLEDVSVSVGEHYPKIVFAPNSSPSLALLGGAIADLARDESIDGEVDLFIEIGLVGELLPWLSATTQIGVLLDLSVAPEQEFVAAMALLKERELIVPERWCGLKVYDSRDGSFKDADDAKLETLGLSKIMNTSIV